MDPHANIAQQRELAEEIEGIRDRCDDRGEFTSRDANRLQDVALELSELVLALDEWRSKGGFDPYTPDAHSTC